MDKPRRMTQMSGVLTITRLPVDAPSNGKPHKKHKVKPRAARVLLQPKQLQLSYAEPDDEKMEELHGRLDLRQAKLEQLENAFVIHAGDKCLKLQDEDKATTDVWFYAVYNAITGFAKTQVGSIAGGRFTAMVTSSYRDEALDDIELEVSCQLLLPMTAVKDAKPRALKWKTWKSAIDVQDFDDELRTSLGPAMKRITFPRDRMRDSLFGGLRKKFIQELKEQQIANYFEKVFALPDVVADPVIVSKVRRFLGFDAFFDENGANATVVNQPEANEPEQPVASIETETGNHDTANADAAHALPQPEEGAELTDSFAAPRETRRASLGSAQHGFALARQRSSLGAEEDWSAQLNGSEYVEVIPETDPAAAKLLHKRILLTVREYVFNDDERVCEFQDQTRDFGRGKTSATEYCAFLHGCVGASECLQLLPEMARLLPDDDLREELLQARAAIWRRVHRRHRRRSKQFSEPVVLQQRPLEVAPTEQQVEPVRKPRPKSDTFSLPSADKNLDARPLRMSMAETRRNSFEDRRPSSSSFTPAATVVASTTVDTASTVPPHGRASLNLFGEPIHTHTIVEESLSMSEVDDDLPNQRGNNQIADDSSDDWESDDDNVHSSSYAEIQVPHSAPAAVPQHTPVDTWPRKSVGNRAAPLSETQMDSNGHHMRTSNQGEAVHEQPSPAPAQRKVIQSNAWIRQSSNSQIKDNAEEEELNPVLARLKKQGAVNFMMR
ncbi:TPA: hypothetical protein N0F65_012033 [Lagenidium giganteum]|uniref:ZNF598/HEL2 PAH domain-containing protein n=1 Tax=Lagenidium giganteum TaxID=4803 RepID=A0AAV2YS47_9STRA|nr:TPA: hypothetical protein N0F65_012033 [Lagenidium giganteum]